MIHVPSVSTQIMGPDCGLYAIANNMFEFCHGGFNNVIEENLTCKFLQDGLRSHLINCFSCDNCSLFVVMSTMYTCIEGHDDWMD